MASAAGIAFAGPRALVAVPGSALAADSLVIGIAPSPGRLTAFRAWARGATLDDLMYLLRRSTGELGDLEAPALEAALARVPGERAELRERLSARLSNAAVRRGRRAGSPVAASLPPVSVFRVALLLPAASDDGGDGTELEAGFRAGLDSRRASGRPPIECLTVHTAADAPSQIAAAFDSVSALAALVCGGLHRSSALVLAAASRWSGQVALLPAIDDPGATRLSSRAWAVGPTAEQRGAALAEAMSIGPTDRVAAITSTATDTAFASGFLAACRVRGATIGGRFSYASGNLGFTTESRALISQRATVLFWDGDPTEAAPLLRQLTRDRVSLRVCGGDGFDPARHHRETRVLLEGVMYVPADWSLSDAARSELDHASDGTPHSGPLFVRGWLAGRVAGAAIAAGAYTPVELATAIERLSPDTGSSLRVLGVRGQGAELEVLTVSDGRALPVQ